MWANTKYNVRLFSAYCTDNNIRKGGKGMGTCYVDRIKTEDGTTTDSLEHKTVKLDIFKKTNKEINSLVAKYQEHIQSIYHCF